MATALRNGWKKSRIGQVFWSLPILLAAGLHSANAQQGEQPNIVFFFLDDATYDEIGDSPVDKHFPNIRRYLQDAGTRFTNFHVVLPLCAPSRGSLFRAQYPHNTDIKVTAEGFTIFHDNGYTDSEMGMWMKDAGYSTALVGKYCHKEYPQASRDPGYVPPGWDEFHASLGGIYYDVSQVSNGTPVRTPKYPDGYRTDVERDTAVSIVDQHEFGKPLFLYIPVYAPHMQTFDSPDPMIAPRHANLYSEEIVPRVPSFNEADVSDKTPQYAALPFLDERMIEVQDERYRNRLRSVKAVDELVGEVVRSLIRKGELDNTYLFLTSDNGYQQGHHRDNAKKDPFDRTTRVELLVRGPGVPADLTTNHLLAHIDLAPTFATLGQSRAPTFVDGRSFEELMLDPLAVPENSWRRDLLIENTETKRRGELVLDTNYVALRMYDSIYVEWNNGDREYYDLDTDPFQLENRYSQLNAVRIERLEARMDEMRDCRGTECRGGGPAEDFSTTLSVSNDQVFRSDVVPLAGSVSASQPVGSVELVIRRVADRAYWNGTRFIKNYRTVDASLNDSGNRWSYSFDVPPNGERYWVSARGSDTNGNQDPRAATAFFQVNQP